MLCPPPHKKLAPYMQGNGYQGLAQRGASALTTDLGVAINVQNMLFWIAIKGDLSAVHSIL